MNYIDKLSAIEKATKFVDQTKIPLGGELGEMQIDQIRSTILDSRRDLKNVEAELEKWKDKYNNLVDINLGKANDFTLDIKELKVQNDKQRKDLAEVATEIGTVQEIGPILARVKTLVFEEDQLRVLREDYKDLKNKKEPEIIIKKNLIESLTELVDIIKNYIKQWQQKK